jgi:D-arabinose 1-dehydrogenase-like Zn-dependent alcohol dehydrogenase
MPYERDWLDADACAYLHDLGATAFAWEFLRRNCAYRAAYQAISGPGHGVAEMSVQVAHQWGLRFRGRSQPGRGSGLCGVAAGH